LFGTISTGDTIMYAVAQTVGGCAGAVIANVMFELDAINISARSRSSGALWLSEVVATIGLLLVIHGCVRTGRASVVPFAVGAWIGGAYWFTSRRASPTRRHRRPDPVGLLRRDQTGLGTDVHPDATRRCGARLRVDPLHLPPPREETPHA
jgi:hypothetical protein